jgi:hypothetical protein
MFRTALSRVSLLVVLLIVMKLAGAQFKPTADSPPPREVAQADARQVQSALRLAAAARAYLAVIQRPAPVDRWPLSASRARR